MAFNQITILSVGYTERLGDLIELIANGLFLGKVCLDWQRFSNIMIVSVHYNFMSKLRFKSRLLY